MKIIKWIVSLLIIFLVFNYTIDDWLDGGDWFSVSVSVTGLFLITWIWLKKDTRIEFYLTWVLTNIAGIIAGMVIGGFILLIPLDLMSDSTEIIGVVFVTTAIGSIFGAAQWLVLRRRFDNPKQWILLTIIGLVVGGISIYFLSVFSDSSSTELPPYVSSSIFGFSLGMAQWFHLKQQIKGASWWVLISVIGATAGVMAMVKYDCNCGIDSPIGALFLMGNYLVVYAGVYALITGLFLTIKTSSILS